MRTMIIALLAILALPSARAETIYAEGFVSAFAGYSGGYGYDTGGYFGPQGASLVGLPFIATWTGTNCNCYGGPSNPPEDGGPSSGPITSAFLTINGIPVDVIAFGGIRYDEWLDKLDGTPRIIQVDTYSGASLTTWSPDTTGLTATGVFYLGSTHAYLNVAYIGPTLINVPDPSVPAPTIGAGLPSLILASAGILSWRRRKHPSPSASR